MNQNRTGLPMEKRDFTFTEHEGGKHYLLFAGSDRDISAGGPVAKFTDERQARNAFVNLRLCSATPDAWGQLASLDPSSGLEMLCWFGPVGDPSTNRRLTSEEPLADGRSVSSGRRLLRRSKGVSTASTNDVAVADPRRTRRGLRGAAAALTLAMTALVGGFALIERRPASSRSDVASSTQSPHPVASAGVLVGYEVIQTSIENYAPGTSRSWKTSDGTHEVVVLAGTLSVEDGGDHQHDYTAGESYVAGWEPYITRNRTAIPVSVKVKYLRPVGDPNPLLGRPMTE